eukprot:1999765-Pyramimonas_sp.AAC.1
MGKDFAGAPEKYRKQHVESPAAAPQRLAIARTPSPRASHTLPLLWSNIPPGLRAAARDPDRGDKSATVAPWPACDLRSQQLPVPVYLSVS